MRVRSVLGRAVRPFLLCLSLGAIASACGGRDSLIVGPFGDDDNEAGADGIASGGSAAGVGAGGKSSVGGSSTGGGGQSGFGNGTGGSSGFGNGTGGNSGFGNGTGGNSGFGNGTGGSSGFGQGGSAGFDPNGGHPAIGGASGFGSFPSGGAFAGGASGFGQGGSSSAGSPNGGFGSGGFATGGAAGGSGSGGLATLGTDCSTPGALACHGPAQRLMLLCEDGAWRSNGTCPQSQNCDRETGVCATIVPRCADKQPGQRVCNNVELDECGPDLVTVTNLANCTGLCVATSTSASCAPEVCGDGRTQSGEECDDGDDIDTDDCTNACTSATCGDGSIHANAETCDDGNREPGDSCSIVCGANPVQVALGYQHTCALGDSGNVQCWGYNATGQCGSGDTRSRGSSSFDLGPALPVVNLGTDKTAVALFAGYHTSCALLNDESLKCLGLNSYGGLGTGDTSPRGTATNQLGDELPAVDLGSGRHALLASVGYAHTCALLDDHSVKCWGYNGLGQLGIGDPAARGDVPSELGDALLPVDLGTGRSALAVGAGDAHTCALLDDHSVKCWGYNSYGQLGLGDTNDRGYLLDQMGDNLPAVDLGTGRSATAIAVSDYHNCAILDDGSVKCWGYNGYGQLGLGDTGSRGYFADQMGDNLPSVNLGSGHTATAIAVGTYTSCAILENASVKCWGYNYAGGLGVGDGSTRGDNANEMGDLLPAVSLGAGRTAKAISVGTGHTCGILDNGAIKCWGSNIYGQLGVGSSVNLGDAAGELGDNLPYVVVTF